MKQTSAVLTAITLTHSLHQTSPFSIAPQNRSARRSKLAIDRPRGRRLTCPPLQASTFAQKPWDVLRFLPNFNEIREEDRDVSLLSLEGGATKVTWPNLLSVAPADEVEDHLVSEINSLSETFSDLQSSIDVKSNLYEETLSTYRAQLMSLEEENSFLEESMKMLTLTLEKQADEIAKFNTERYDMDFVKALQEENEFLKGRVRGLEVELSDFAFESRKIVEPVVETTVVREMKVESIVSESLIDNEEVAQDTLFEAEEVDLTPKAPSAPIPQHILQQHEIIQLQKQLQAYEEERSNFRQLVGLCFKKATNKVGMAINLWRPIYLLLIDARKGASNN